MTKPTKKRVVKTPGQVAYEQWRGEHTAFPQWSLAGPTGQEMWEDFAVVRNIPPLTEDVPEPQKTDGELLYEAARPHTICGVLGAADKVAAEFLRLLRERDGEPLDVTKEWLFKQWDDWEHLGARMWDVIAAKINAHRGVRPVQIPQVTAEMCKDAVNYTWRNIPSCSPSDMADFINAELAKQAGKVGELCQ